MQNEPLTVRRRDLLSLIGTVAGSAAMYQTMTALGVASESRYTGPIHLDGDAKGASVLVIGAGLAGMTAALELRQAGYKVLVLEFNDRPGGRNWTLRGGDSFVELGGFKQTCAFEKGLHLDPGPWRIPYHHRALLDYCKRLGVALEPFVQVNHNAYLHASGAFGGAPQRIRAVKADFQGQISELLAKVANQGDLDQAVSVKDKEILLLALKSWGALDHNYKYREGLIASGYRGYAKPPGGGLSATPLPSEPVALSDILKSQLWRYFWNFARYELQTTMFQPVGGMDMIGKAFARELGELIRYNAKVTEIWQNDSGVTVTYVDANNPTQLQKVTADWCLCAIPLSILSQLPINVGAAMKAAIDAVPYGASVKVGLQFKRRFWEEDDAIYGGSATRICQSVRSAILTPTTTSPAAASCSVLIFSRTPMPSSSPPCRRMSAWRARSSSAPSSILNTGRSSRTASRLPGTGCHSRLGVAATGRRRPASSIIAIYVGSTGAFCSLASTRRHCRLGRRAQSSPHLMPSRGCMSGWSSHEAKMRRRFKHVIFAAIAALLLRSSHPLLEQNDPKAPKTYYFSSSDRFGETTGEQLYINVCRGCHMIDAMGASGAASYPSLVANRNLDASFYAIDVVLNGRRGMPSFGGMMDDDQIAAVVNYLRTHFGNSYSDAVMASDVQAARR